MLKKEMTKSEIEKELQGKGDYVQIDLIRRLLKENIATDTKKFALLKLVTIYENRKMFSEASDLYGKLSELAMNSAERSSFFIKEVEDYVKSGFFDMADLVMNKLLSETVKYTDKAKITSSIIGFYKTQAEVYEKEKRRSKAVEIYEKLLTMKVSDSEKAEAKDKLLKLYNGLGMIDKYIKLKESPSSPKPAKPSLKDNDDFDI